MTDQESAILKAINLLAEDLKVLQEVWRSQKADPDLIREDINKRQNTMNELRKSVGMPAVFLPFPGLWE